MNNNYEQNHYLVKALLDLIILCMLDNEPKCGYEIIAVVHIKFGVLLSPGTVYPLLYSMERKNLLEISLKDRKKLYSLTTRGKERTTKLLTSYQKMFHKLSSFIEV